MSHSGFACDYITLEAVTADDDATIAADTGLVLYGWNAHESNGTPAIAQLHIVEGATGAAGTVVAGVKLAASQSRDHWFGDRGVYLPAGLSIDWIAGEFDVTLYYKVF